MERKRPPTPSALSRLRLGQVIRRCNLPASGSWCRRRLRHQQRRSLRALVPRRLGGGPAGGHRVWRRDRALHGRGGRGGDRGDRRAATEPSRGRYLPQEAAARGAQLVVMDPRGTELDRTPRRWRASTRRRRGAAQRHAARDPDGGFARPAIRRRALIGIEELRAHVAGYAPEAMEALCGVPAEQVRRVARLYAAHARGWCCGAWASASRSTAPTTPAR